LEGGRNGVADRVACEEDALSHTEAHQEES
jgi:hypothetical protein